MAGRLSPSQADVLAMPIRQRLLDLVEQRPEISLQEIADALELSRTALLHHRHVLVKAGILYAHKDGHRIVLTAWRSKRPPKALALRETLRGAAKVVAAASAPITAAQVGMRLGISERTARYHLNRLAAASLVSVVRSRPSTFYGNPSLQEMLKDAPDSRLD